MVLAGLTVLGTLALSGCSRSVLNYQLAECIGTLNQYENNEPVETPKMKAERELRESEEALESEKVEALDQAEAMAGEYRYQEAISYLENTDILSEDERSQEAVAKYQAALDDMYEYEGDIVHFSFTNLVIDTARAFDGDDYDSMYRSNMITLKEFQSILQTLYESGYILIDIHSLAEETGSGSQVTMTAKLPTLPKGKKPMILSVDNLSYSSPRNGDGVATKLALDSEGNVAAVYTDEEGHERRGAYDVVPVLEEFIGEHPDFSYQGARGIISVAGKNGIFGYPVNVSEGVDNSENEAAIRQIADKLKEDGWTFACAGYSYEYMGDMSYDALREDITSWQTKVAPLVGACDTLLYPYGSEVDYTTEKGAFLINQGFRYLVGLWAIGDHLEVNTDYLRQTRRNVTGFVFANSPNAFDDYFSAAAVLDEAR